MKRVFIIVLDSCGIGMMPDGPQFGDVGVNTLASCQKTGLLSLPNLEKAGLGLADGVSCLKAEANPTGAVARLSELSMGKDTTIGHWEIAGLISPKPLPTYPNGFPPEVLEAFTQATGRGVLCNLPYSGTQVIQDYGRQQLETGKWIVYTSADSVFQIAAHEELIPLAELYDACRAARNILQGRHGVGRVIARPYVGSPETGFTRTANRHDFSLAPPGITLPDAVKAAGLESISVGKIYDIFAHRGFTRQVYTTGNADGLAKTLAYAGEDFHGLCFVNLVDFDMLYGHRRDTVGYAKALNEFDRWLPDFLSKLGPEDLVMITADHGCDPGYAATTDHTREYVPLVCLGPGVKPGNLGTLPGFAHIAATAADVLGVELDTPCPSLARQIC